ncbi:surface-adhesin E family protein [Vogesella oryzae]|uniref:surface-adhesin E family protein n=1 Tax=Vogesella oryzae TaxID=1735285 RepID=UPI0015814514|nr:surface-adhesin E family protein [Vogesella oryzae]
MKTWAIIFVILAALAGMSWYWQSWDSNPVQQGKFEVYQSGDALELSLDLDAIANVNEGFVRFVNQERFADKKQEPALGISYQVRRLEGRADCQNRQYAFVNTSYWTANGKHVYTQMFQLQRFNWTFIPVETGSIADTMLQIVCRLAPDAPRLKIE